mmetsp:Transcript_106130/g.329625  ORF Transcript_106130/g.329625 Transcript_106130/m.329625 type:complete len:201 (-) Transcript_106130:167-769(-)
MPASSSRSRSPRRREPAGRKDSRDRRDSPRRREPASRKDSRDRRDSPRREEPRRDDRSADRGRRQDDRGDARRDDRRGGGRRDERSPDRRDDRGRKGSTGDPQKDAEELNDPNEPDFHISVEGPNATHCYRASVQTIKPETSAAGRAPRGGTKMRVTAAWQGDKKSAYRDAVALTKAWKRGGFDAVYKMKTELRDKRFGR